MLNRETSLVVNDFGRLRVTPPQHRHAIYNDLTCLRFLNDDTKLLPSPFLGELRNQLLEKVAHARAHVANREVRWKFHGRTCTAQPLDHPLHVLLSFRPQVFGEDELKHSLQELRAAQVSARSGPFKDLVARLDRKGT